MKTYDILLFDIDNTLLDFDYAEDQALTKTLYKLSIPNTKEIKDDFRRINSRLWKMYEKKEITKEKLLQDRFILFFQKYHYDSLSYKAKEINDYYLQNLSDCGVLIPYAKEILIFFHKTKKIYLISNGVYKTQMSRLVLSGILEYIDGVFISENIGYPKPEKEFFDHVFNKLLYPNKESVLIIGDSLSADILGGKNYGLDTCYFTLRTNKEDSLNDISTYKINDLRKLKEIIE